jgi:hypothetical protein
LLAEKYCMPRPLRFIPEKSLVEITTRALQGRLLLKPSPELTDLILGVIGKAQTLYGMTIHASSSSLRTRIFSCRRPALGNSQSSCSS